MLCSAACLIRLAHAWRRLCSSIVRPSLCSVAETFSALCPACRARHCEHGWNASNKFYALTRAADKGERCSSEMTSFVVVQGAKASSMQREFRTVCSTAPSATSPRMIDACDTLEYPLHGIHRELLEEHMSILLANPSRSQVECNFVSHLGLLHASIEFCEMTPISSHIPT